MSGIRETCNLELLLPAAGWARSQNLTLQEATGRSYWEIPFPVFISPFLFPPQARPQRAEGSAAIEGGARHSGTSVQDPAGPLHRVHEPLPRRRQQWLAGAEPTQSLLCLL